MPSATATPAQTPSPTPGPGEALRLTLHLEAANLYLSLPGDWRVFAPSDQGLFAVGLQGEGVSVYAEPKLDHSLSSWTAETAAVWIDEGATISSTTPDTVAGTEARRLTGTMQRDGDRVRLLGEAFVHGDMAYIVTWQSPPAPAIEASFELLLDSIALVAGPRSAHTSASDSLPLSVTIPAGVEFGISEREYEISGDTAGELSGAMLSYTQSAAVGSREYAPWYWNVTWDYDRVPGLESCMVENIYVSLDVEVTYPHWIPPTQATQSLVANWQSFVGALRVHQVGHTQAILDKAGEVNAALAALAAEPECDSLETVVNAAAEEVVERAREADRAYDERTNRGWTQGVHPIR